MRMPKNPSFSCTFCQFTDPDKKIPDDSTKTTEIFTDSSLGHLLKNFSVYLMSKHKVSNENFAKAFSGTVSLIRKEFRDTILSEEIFLAQLKELLSQSFNFVQWDKFYINQLIQFLEQNYS